MLLSPEPMHIPDGFLSVLVSAFFWLLTLIFVGIAVNRSKDTLKDRQIPLMGIMAAFIFAAQMINFPVAGGTSGHLLGGALAAIVLGPWSGILVMTSVIALQGLMFQDGGLVVMGANIFNMGILTAMIGYGLYAAVARQKHKGVQVGVIGIAAWLSVMASALVASFQIWLSGTSPARVVFPAMLSVHMLIGIGEALITIAAFSFIRQVRPDILENKQTAAKNNAGWIIVGGLISLGVVLLSPFASADPDGLERVAADVGFLSLAQDTPYKIFADYVIPALGDGGFSTAVAGIIGILAVGGIAFLIGWIIQKTKAKGSTP
ncbi:MAG: energy-coupling factor ABC transporter permease [Anaerolineales bacterium]